MPEIRLVDLRRERPPRGGFLSPPLREVLGRNLAEGAQSLLFLNLYAKAGSYDSLQASGYLEDAVHESATGATYMADQLWSLIDSAADAPSVPEPGSATIALAGFAVIALKRRRRAAR